MNHKYNNNNPTENFSSLREQLLHEAVYDNTPQNIERIKQYDNDSKTINEFFNYKKNLIREIKLRFLKLGVEELEIKSPIQGLIFFQMDNYDKVFQSMEDNDAKPKSGGIIIAKVGEIDESDNDEIRLGKVIITYKDYKREVDFDYSDCFIPETLFSCLEQVSLYRSKLRERKFEWYEDKY